MKQPWRALVSGVMAAATSLGAVLSNGSASDNPINLTVVVATTVIAFILHAGKDLKGEK